MEETIRQAFDPHARIFKALGHPARLFIVHQLSLRGECGVGRLRDALGLDMSTVSKHLSVLREAGVVASTKRGSAVLYRVAMPCVPHFMDCVDAARRGEEAEPACDCAAQSTLKGS
jgi:ArsR family transcriptional regulator